MYIQKVLINVTGKEICIKMFFFVMGMILYNP